MKKRLFFAVVLTAILFAACGKQEKNNPKEMLVQEFEQFCQGEGESSLAAFQEKFAIYKESDFSEDQLERINNAASKIGFNPFATYILSPNFEENLKALEQECLELEK